MGHQPIDGGGRGLTFFRIVFPMIVQVDTISLWRLQGLSHDLLTQRHQGVEQEVLHLTRLVAETMLQMEILLQDGARQHLGAHHETAITNVDRTIFSTTENAISKELCYDEREDAGIPPERL